METEKSITGNLLPSKKSREFDCALTCVTVTCLKTDGQTGKGIEKAPRLMDSQILITNSEEMYSNYRGDLYSNCTRKQTGGIKFTGCNQHDSGWYRIMSIQEPIM